MSYVKATATDSVKYAPWPTMCPELGLLPHDQFLEQATHDIIYGGDFVAVTLWSMNIVGKSDLTAEYTLEHEINIFFITET